MLRKLPLVRKASLETGDHCVQGLWPAAKLYCMKYRGANMRLIADHFSRLASEANREAYGNPWKVSLVIEQL